MHKVQINTWLKALTFIQQTHTRALQFTLALIVRISFIVWLPDYPRSHHIAQHKTMDHNIQPHLRDKG